MTEVYRDWVPSYDGPNSMIDVEQPIVHTILDSLSVGTVLDAACGTSRHAADLALDVPPIVVWHFQLSA
jgi:hypothetical protein